MNNHTKSILHPGVWISLGYFLSIFCLLCILILILVIVFLCFNKQQDDSLLDEYELSNDSNANANERSSFKCQRAKQYLSTGSFRMNIDEQNTDSNINVISSK